MTPPRPILDAIAAAKKSLRIKMFLFSDPALLAAVIAAQKRGVKVRVMLNPARRGGEPENEATRRKLEKAGVEVIDTNPAFAVTHEKSMVVDDETAFVKSLNWETKNLTETRDYAVTTEHRGEVDEIVACFEADWHRKSSMQEKRPRASSGVITTAATVLPSLSTGQRTHFSSRTSATRTPSSSSAWCGQRRRGVKIHVMARPPHTLKKEKLVEGVGGIRILDDVGVKVHKLKHLKLHAKMLLADGKRAIVGSINLSPGSFDSRRELAIEVDDKHLVKRLHRVARHDWKHSHPLDLTDEGLMADLEKRGGKGAEKLALNVAKEKNKKRKN